MKMKKKLETIVQDGDAAIELSEEVIEEMSTHLRTAGVGKSGAETILLLVKTSKGAICFETTLEELTVNYYPDYFRVKASDVKKSKNLKSNIRSRVNYLENRWETKDAYKYFEILSKKCAEGQCAAAHSKRNPNPDIITIRLDFLADWERRITRHACVRGSTR